MKVVLLPNNNERRQSMKPNELKAWRKAYRVALPAMAKLSGVPCAVISAYENGNIGNLSEHYWKLIRKVMSDIEESKQDAA
jgi:predicted transcriptional regulator